VQHAEVVHELCKVSGMRYKERKFRYANWIDWKLTDKFDTGVTCFNKLPALCNPTSPVIQGVSKILGKLQE